MDRAPRQAGCRLMLDSGAYSAFTRDDSIDLHAYIRFVKANRDHLFHYINLDIIPGMPGSGHRELRPKAIEQASRQSYENFLRMKDAGLDPIPVVHQYEDFNWLDRYRANGARYIALAPWDGGIHCGNWIQDCLTVLFDPTIQVHLLGVNSHPVLHHFFPTSADAGTWYQQAASGHIPVPVLRKGKPDYALPADTIALGHQLRKNHFDLMDEFDQERARRYLEQECGVPLGQARSDYRCRWRIWIKYFNALAASTRTTIYFATSADRQMVNTLAQSGAPYHLLSFYALRKKPDDTLERYVRDYDKLQRQTPTL